MASRPTPKQQNSGRAFPCALGPLGFRRGVFFSLVLVGEVGWFLGSPNSLAQPTSASTPPKVRVTISKETTYITEPLRPDGYPDYLAALNQRLSQGVTPENNAAVLFWRAMGPKPIPEKIRQEYVRRLGLPPLPEQGAYFQPFEEYAASIAKQAGQELSSEQIDQMYRQAMEGPWKAEQFPLVAQWLQANEKPLVLLIEASRRPRRYEPLVVGQPEENQPEMLLAVLLPAAGQMREVARTFRIRAMYRLGQGKTAEAWEDLLTIHRLARLMGQGPTLVENLVAASMEYLACQADQVLAAEGNLSAQQALGFRDALSALPPLPPMADKIDLGERFMYLDVVCTLARGIKPSARLFELLDGGPGQTPEWAKRLGDFLASVGQAMIDWDVVLRMGNPWYDRLVEAGRKPTSAQRRQAVETIEHQIRQLAEKNKNPMGLVVGVLAAPRQKISQQIGEMLVALVVPAVSAVYVAEDRAAMYRQWSVCSFALAAYRAEQGKYPERLADLVPRYLAAVPADVFAQDRPVIYRRTEEGLILYSVGPNGRDDGGRSPDDTPAEGQAQGDDLVVRMKSPTAPRPKQK